MAAGRGVGEAHVCMNEGVRWVWSSRLLSLFFFFFLGPPGARDEGVSGPCLTRVED